MESVQSESTLVPRDTREDFVASIQRLAKEFEAPIREVNLDGLENEIAAVVFRALIQDVFDNFDEVDEAITEGFRDSLVFAHESVDAETELQLFKKFMNDVKDKVVQLACTPKAEKVTAKEAPMTTPPNPQVTWNTEGHRPTNASTPRLIPPLHPTEASEN